MDAGVGGASANPVTFDQTLKNICWEPITKQVLGSLAEIDAAKSKPTPNLLESD